MPSIRVELDTESFRRLTKLAVEERRPIPWQAEMLLLRALAEPCADGGAGRETQLPVVPEEVPCAAE